MPKLTRTFRKAFKLASTKKKYLEVDELMTKKEKQQLFTFIAVVSIPFIIGFALLLLN